MPIPTRKAHITTVSLELTIAVLVAYSSIVLLFYATSTVTRDMGLLTESAKFFASPFGHLDSYRGGGVLAFMGLLVYSIYRAFDLVNRYYRLTVILLVVLSWTLFCLVYWSF